MSLLNTFKGLLTSGLVDKLATLVGGNSSIVKSGITAVLPSLLKGIVSKGSSTSGAGQLLDLIKTNNLSTNMAPDASLMSTGAKINESIFGSALKNISIPGMSSDKGSSLLNAVTPLLMGSLGKVISDKNLDANGLSSFLKQQQPTLTKVSNETTFVKDTVTEEGSNAMGILKWLLPLILISSLAYWFLNKGNDTQVEAAPTQNIEQTKSTKKTVAPTHTHSDGSVHSGHSHGSEINTTKEKTTSKKKGNTIISAKSNNPGVKVAGYALDADGNLLKNGKLFLKQGEYSVKDGEYFTAEGRSLGMIGKTNK